MIGKQFTAVMTKNTFVCQNNETFVQVSLKHTNVGDVQSFMELFEKKLETTNIQTNFEYPVRWNKMSFDIADYDPNYYHIKFDEIDFYGKLLSIQVTRKLDDGIDSFDYTLNFQKEVGSDNEDSIVAKTYLKHKEPEIGPDGEETNKMIMVQYPVKIELAEDPNAESVNSGYNDGLL